VLYWVFVETGAHFGAEQSGLWIAKTDLIFIPKLHVSILGYCLRKSTCVFCPFLINSEATRYKSEGHKFESRWCHWNFLLTKSFRPQYGPGVDSASNGNEYQEYFLMVKAASV